MKSKAACKFKVGQRVIKTTKRPVSYRNGVWEYSYDKYEVKIMAISGIYAMARRKGAMPFVVDLKELSDDLSQTLTP